MKKTISLLALIFILNSLFNCTGADKKQIKTNSSETQPNPDREAVKRAVLDYVEALYNTDSTLVYRGVSKGLAKIGVGDNSIETTTISDGRLDFQGLVNLVNNWNKDKETDPKTAIKEVIIYDVLSHTASVKLSASWGIDYMHLGKYGNKWKIVNVIYQGYPDDDE